MHLKRKFAFLFVLFLCWFVMCFFAFAFLMKNEEARMKQDKSKVGMQEFRNEKGRQAKHSTL